MTKHTDGEWKAIKKDIQDKNGNIHDNLIRIETDEQSIAEIYTPYYHELNKGKSERNANARLIAAAPELLEACKEAVNAIHEALGDLTDYFTIKHVKGSLETIEEAITKATSL